MMLLASLRRGAAAPGFPVLVPQGIILEIHDRSAWCSACKSTKKTKGGEFFKKETRGRQLLLRLTFF
jgi:hypothetical protein